MDYRRCDSRIESLSLIISGLEASINHLNKQYQEIDWYDGGMLLEETEPIFGLALIAFQNYINGSVYDYPDSGYDKIQLYAFDGVTIHQEKTPINLIIGLANYYKHKDDEQPHKGTREILEYFSLGYSKELNLEDSPIFKGLTILSPKWDLSEILRYVEQWREKLWVNYDDKQSRSKLYEF